MRDIIIIFLLIVIAIGGGAWLLMNGATLSVPSVSSLFGSGSVAFTEVAHGTTAASVRDRVNYRIQNADQLAVLFSMVYDGNAPVSPSIDFSKNEVIAVFDGSHSSGGYGIAVSRVQDSGTTRTVVVTHTAPGDSCASTSAITSPYQIVIVPKTTLTLAHEDKTVTTTCP